ncbi:tRNA (guanosine(46)-N7)-methyltransferase TrmB [Clostridium sp. HMP27]|uniref:tRNA (guanosine(46)-N7)-methyltransferase TrmB n=1 Tax=Clostridium sp. HMP27 TaxID=1487921 RepID=UPI00052D59D7|nr:tRNA (guanosine(46)-N7)-methyltransferase TrmB [Clostridium sp. HMP27]KGK86975.1 tRNA (guanine-N7)-methyltransferase [Clostridium sp. HMP27]
MRLRKKWWARPEMEASPLVITNPREYKGKWKEEFKNDNPVHLELGCGRGGFIAQKAVQNPDVNYIAVDLKDEVLIYVLKKIEELEITNVRIVPLNIMFISEVFDKDEIEKIYINFCNPWPKERHNKRRLTHTRFLAEYKNFLKAGSEIWFKTDDTDLFNASQEYFKESGFAINYLTYDLHESDFDKNIMTEYEKKFTQLGMKTMFLIGRL